MEADPLELYTRGYRVVRFYMRPEETDLRYERQPANVKLTDAGTQVSD